MIHHSFDRTDFIEVIETVEQRRYRESFPVCVDKWDGHDWRFDTNSVITGLLVAFRIIILNRDGLLELVHFELDDEAAVDNDGIDVRDKVPDIGDLNILTLIAWLLRRSLLTFLIHRSGVADWVDSID